jgi:hypothetical protein
MGLQARSFGAKKDHPAEGTHMARLVNLIDLGHQPGFEYNGEPIKSSYKITFTYELCNSVMEDGRPHFVPEDVNVSNYVGDGITSKMMKRVFALDPDDVLSNGGKELAKLIGQPCMVSVKYNKNGYPQIKDVVAAPAGIPVPSLVNTPVIFNMDAPDMDAYNKFADFVKGKLKAALDLNDTELGKALLLEDDSSNESF